MKIIRVKSGLGNQMFQYALYRQLEYMGQDVRLDVSYINKNQEHNGYELDKVFYVAPRYATAEELEYCQRRNGGIYGTIRTALTSKEFFSEIERFVNKDLFYIDDILINGYWQHLAYFRNVVSELKREFVFRMPLDEKNVKYMQDIQAGDTVSIHIRKTDYLSEGFKKWYGCICDVCYYKRAIDAIYTLVKNPQFYIFSDDFEWVNQNLQIPNAIYIQGNTGEMAYIDMYLMSLCKHNIISNSTFSWWAAWLNKNPDKIVMEPDRWCASRRKYKNSLVSKEWIRIKT